MGRKKGNRTVQSFLVPATHVPSLRHFVVYNRGIDHFMDAVRLFDELMTEPKIDMAKVKACQEKAILVLGAIDELDEWVERNPSGGMEPALDDLARRYMGWHHILQGVDLDE